MNCKVKSFFELLLMDGRDEYFGDIHSMVVDREIELLYQMQIRVLEHSSFLIECSDLLTELDCLLSFAEAAKRYNYCKPEMTEDSVLHIQQGRHPIKELSENTFVPNDLSCVGRESSGLEAINLQDEDDSPNLILMTGANHSGKSVYLKQAALIVYMAHLGSFVPATSAQIGITDRILSRLQTRETVTKAESGFLIDLQQVSIALQTMTAKSLLVIDEFGKGTEGIDGASLFGALVNYLTDPDRVRPRSLLATHFHEVLTPTYLRMSSAMSLKHMQIIIDKQAEELSNQITYLFEVADGPSLSSYGINCAALGGIPDHILARAEQLVEISTRGDSLVDAMAVLSSAEKEELRLAEAMARRFAAWDISAESDETLLSKLAEIVAE